MLFEAESLFHGRSIITQGKISGDYVPPPIPILYTLMLKRFIPNPPRLLYGGLPFCIPYPLACYAIFNPLM